jgi:hypothetical protein
MISSSTSRQEGRPSGPQAPPKGSGGNGTLVRTVRTMNTTKMSSPGINSAWARTSWLLPAMWPERDTVSPGLANPLGSVEDGKHQDRRPLKAAERYADTSCLRAYFDLRRRDA